MTEAEWLACEDPRPMLAFVHKQMSERKLRLFGLGCCQRILAQIQDDRSLRAVKVLERFIEGQATEEELTTAEEEADLAAGEGADFGLWTVAYAASTYVGTFRQMLFDSEYAEEEKGEADVLRDILGPIRRIAFNATWRTATVTALAEAIYDDRAIDRLPILADALEDAGCTERDILDHCRQPGVHVRGCWVVDLILGKS